MRTTTTVAAGVAALALAFSLTACSGSDDMTAPDDMASSSASSDAMDDSGSMTTLSGTFEGLNEKNVAGTVTIDGDTVTLSDFSSDEGPDLHLYLTNGTDEAAVTAGTELGAVAFDEGSQTFMLDGADAADFTDIVVHCDKVKAVFGAASLS